MSIQQNNETNKLLESKKIEVINLDEVIPALKNTKCESGNQVHALDILIISKNTDTVSIDDTIKISIDSIDKLKRDGSGNYYYEYFPKNHAIIVGNFKCSSKTKSSMSFIIQNTTFSESEINYYPLILFGFQTTWENFCIRVTFLETPKEGEEIILSMTRYLLDITDKLRPFKAASKSLIYNDAGKYLRKCNVISGSLIYSNGSFSRIKTN